MAKQRISVLINIAAFAHGLPGVTNREKYTRALLNEIRSASDYRDDYIIESVLIDGPSPFQYAKETLAGIVDELKQNFSFLPNAEMTIRAMPGSVTYGDLYALRDCGVNRLSFDMQTFVQAELDVLNRTYAPRSMEVFMRMVQLKFVFFNFDVTLFYGLPGQTLDTLRYSIEQAIRFMAAHITLLPYPETQDLDLVSWYQEAGKMIGSLGFQQYTAVHFARPHLASRWNKLVYSNQPRLGFGIGAVSAVDGLLIQNTEDVEAYMEAEGDPEKVILKAGPIPQGKIEINTLTEKLFNLEACEIKSFSPRTKKQIDLLCNQGLLQIRDDLAQLTDIGKVNWPAIVSALD